MLTLKSVQWRLSLIYLLMILLAMQLVGFYLLQSLERYYITGFTDTVGSQGQLLAGFMDRYLVGEAEQGFADKMLVDFGHQAGLEIAVFNTAGLMLASSGTLEAFGQKANQTDVARALAGTRSEEVRVEASTGERHLHVAVPVLSGNQVVGAVYLIGSLEEIYGTLGDVRSILFSATAVALAATAILGFGLARTITRPIKEVTSKAAMMASGDFEQAIEVRSEDEIGQLARMFNHLAFRLKETLSEISDEKAKLEAILTHMADGILALDREGRVLIANPAAARMVGVRPEKAVGKPVSEVLGGILSEEALRETLKGSRGISQEITLRRPVYRALRAQFAPLRNEDGRLAGTVVVFQDITDQERLESLRKEFVANVSHELRTPLTTIKSYVETLLDGAMEDRDLRSHFLEVVDEETDRMVRLVNNLLDLSTLDYEGANLEMKPFSLAGAIRDAVEALAVQSQKRRMTVSIEAPPGPLTALGDRERIQQVAMNLISNAIKFTPEEGDVKVSIHQAGDWYRVSVKDNGIGIPKEDLPRIFDRFYRVDKARSRQLGGTGLGLSIARQIVEAHGGQIEIKSEMGEGTTVTFTLRAAVSRLVDSHEGEPA